MIKPFPNKKYNTIVVDPPWPISLTGKVKRRENTAEKLPYTIMTLDQIKELPISDIANVGAHIYLWTTNKMMRNAYSVFDSWGVNFHLIMPMIKPSGIAPCMGYVFASEFCLLGFMGKPMQKFLQIGRLNWLKNFNTLGKHSTKPEIFYKLVENMSPSPRIDLFARKQRNGWDAWGDEIET
jgi:N6-adenosine-specific RNA methylase IME4